MSTDKIYGGVAAIAVCFGLILFVVWQEKSKKKLIDGAYLDINPQRFPVFEGIEYTKFYVGYFTVRFRDLFRRGEEMMGKWSIYNDAKTLIATVGYSNRIVSTARAGGRWIASDFEQSFAVPIKKISFHEFPGNTPVMAVEPLKNIQIVTIDHTFMIAGNEYRLKSRPAMNQYICDYYCQGEHMGAIAQVSLKNITIAVAQQEIDPLALAFVFDLFSRYTSR